MIDQSIFRSYDIRGTYPEQINEDAAYRIGRSMVRVLNAKKVVVGQDVRLSSPSLKESLIKGIREEDADVIDIGLSTTPLLYFSSLEANAQAGVNVTASHNPKGYNGLKILNVKARLPMGKNSGLMDIAKEAEEGDFKQTEMTGKLEEKTFLKEYISHVLGFINQEKIKDLRLVVDTGNGTGGITAEELFKNLNCQVIPLYWKPDGNFPNHLANPALPENLKDLKERVVAEKAHLGIALDGDADRIIFINEKGEEIRGDFITAFMAQRILKAHPGQKVLFDLTSTRALNEVVKENDGVPIATPRGNTLIKELMFKENAVFGGELTGHYFLADNNNLDSPLIVLLNVLESLSEQKISMSEMMKDYQRYYQSGEINMEVKDKELILKKIEEKYKDREISHLDGLSINLGTWWFSLRASNTENLLRLNLEGINEEIVKEKVAEIEKIIAT